MNGLSFLRIINAIAFAPMFVSWIILTIFWVCFEKGEDWILMIMKGIITKKSIDQELKYLVCNRILPDGARYRFVWCSFAIVITCVQCSLIIAMIEVTYNCRHDPGLYCFKKSLDSNPSLINNCSAISKDELVICYRITAFDPEKTLIGASAGYLLFKILTICLGIVANIMLWLAQKWKKKTLKRFKYGIAFILLAGSSIILWVGVFVDEVDSTLRKVSFSVVLQIQLVVFNLSYFVGVLPWQDFRGTQEHYEGASIPSAVPSSRGFRWLQSLRRSRSGSYEML